VRERRRGGGHDASNAVLVTHLDGAELLEVAVTVAWVAEIPSDCRRVTNWRPSRFSLARLTRQYGVGAGSCHELSSLIQRKTPIIAERR